MKKTRDWQEKAIRQAMECYQNIDKHYAIDAAPGAGKTLCAIMLAKEMFDADMIDRVVVIAPRNEIVNQWAKEFKKITKRPMTKLTGVMTKSQDVSEIYDDIASTWAGINGIKDAVQAMCETSRVFVIADEVHHAALEAAWGVGADVSMKDSTYVLALSGTPTRSDGQGSVWLDGAIEARNAIRVTYGETVRERWCVPVTFHRHKGQFDVHLDGETIEVSDTGRVMSEELNAMLSDSVKRALRFEKLIKMPMRDANGKPRLDSYHSTMLDWAEVKLNKLRSQERGAFGMPEAGAIVIAPSIEMAKYFAELIEAKWPGEKATIVHSESAQSAEDLKQFRTSGDRWIVSVNMISEGVDIPRLRVMVFLPFASTELYFRQAIGRIIRKAGLPEEDNSRAYCVVPELGNFIEYAMRIEEEMQAPEPPEPPRCPRCRHEGHRPTIGQPCPSCGYEPQPRPPTWWTCNEHSSDGCGAENPQTARSCQACGKPRSATYSLDIQDASGWREGAITRQEEVTEEEAKASEEIAVDLQTYALKKKDARLLRIMQMIPEEMYSVVGELYAEVQAQQARKGIQA